MLRLLRNATKRVLFGKRKNYGYKRRSFKYNYATWKAHESLRAKVDNLIKHLGLKEIQSTGLIGDPKDAKKFDNQWS